MKSLFTPARVGSILTGIATLTAALAPAVANLDVTSAASGLGGAVVLLGILDRFLVGQRAHEARQAATSTLAPVYVGSGTSNAAAGSIAFTGTTGPITSTPEPSAKPEPVEIPPAAPAPPGDFVPPPAEPTIMGG